VTDATKKRVFAVVLAAGSAARFGSTKQLAPVGGAPLAQHAVVAADAVFAANTVLVVGHDWQAVSKACSPPRGFLVFNDHFADGLGSSLALAVRSLRHAADAVVVLLADQPLVSADHLSAMREVWSGQDDEIVATAFSGTLGPPVLFPGACFDDLVQLHGDSGGHKLLEDERFTVAVVPFAGAALDIDYPDDLQAVGGMFVDRSKAQRSEP
jgi:CTP:molybdopterin cytidylyltransferase MocA